MSTPEHIDQHHDDDALREVLVRLARDLREIGQLTRWLEDEALHHPSSKSMPGGDAMVMLGPSAHRSQYEGRIAVAEARHYDDPERFPWPWPTVPELDSDPQPPAYVLNGWEVIIREELDKPSDMTPTLWSSLDFIGKHLVWLCGNSPITGLPNFRPLDAMRHELAMLRRRLEAVLHDGPDGHAVPCIRCTGDERGVLRPIWGDDIEGDDDQWHCSRCGALLTREDYRRALLAAHRLTATSLSASEMLVVYGIKPDTLRQWAKRGHVSTGRRDASGRKTYDVEQALAQRDAGWDGRLRTAEADEAGAGDDDSDTPESSATAPLFIDGNG